MKCFLASLVVLTMVLCGCTTSSKARSDARAAFYQGQARALSEQLTMAMRTSAPEDMVSILGPVQITALKWTPDLTVAKTIVAAEYMPPGVPGHITIHREGMEIPVSAERLLAGEDVAVLPGDIVEVQP